jgi:hypothetical protein
MPLSAAEQAELALRTVGATYYDPRGLPPLSAHERAELRLRLKENHTAADGAALDVRDHATLVGFLTGWADGLEHSLTIRRETPRTREVVKKVVAVLRDRASRISEDEDGDGLPSDGCPCGVLSFAFAVEQHVRQAYQNAVMHLLNPGTEQKSTGWRIIFYRTYITEDIGKKLGRFNVGGQTRIDMIPAQVQLLIKRSSEILARDLWQLAYILHHEIVCHGFQYASQVNLTGYPNAPVGCHWTEGWMDAAAFALAKAWANCDECSCCFEFRGSSAIGAMQEMHDARYPALNKPEPMQDGPAGISEDDAFLRLYARSAFEALHTVLSQVCEPSEAEEIAVKFSLRLNSHEHASPVTLLQVSTQLQGAFLNTIRTQIASAAASACVAFAGTGDLARLQADLAQALL